MEKPTGSRILIPVAAIEFEEGGNTLWVQSIYGTVLRLKCSGKIATKRCVSSPVSHTDVMVAGDIEVCLAPELVPGGPA